MTLTEFLLARIAEDEAAARSATAPSEMHPWGDRSLPPTPLERWPDEVRGYLGGTLGEHCAHWDPARVLAECDAKRLIVEMDDPRGEWDTGFERALHSVLALLVLPYADHPDYDESWRP